MLKYETKEYDKYEKSIYEGKYLNGKLSKILKEKEKEYNYIKKYDITDNIYNLGNSLGLQNLKFDQNNVCNLVFDKKIKVKIIYNKNIDQCIFASPICSIPENDCEQFFRELLISNAYGANFGAALCIEKRDIVLNYTFIASTFSYQIFYKTLEDFINVAEYFIVNGGTSLTFLNSLNKYISF